MFLLFALVGLTIGILIPLGEMRHERDWPRATIGKASMLIVASLVCLYFCF